MNCENENCKAEHGFTLPVAIKRRGRRTERRNLCVACFKACRLEHRGKARVVVEFHREAISVAIKNTNGNVPVGGLRAS